MVASLTAGPMGCILLDMDDIATGSMGDCGYPTLSDDGDQPDPINTAKHKTSTCKIQNIDSSG